MKRLILYLIVGTVFVNSTFADNKKIEKKESLLILDINEQGTIFIRGKQVSDEKLIQLLNHIAAIDNSFPILIQGDLKTRHTDIKRVLGVVSNTSLYRIKFHTLRKELKTKPVTDLEPEKPLYTIDVNKTGYSIGKDRKTLQDLRNLFSKMADEDKQKKTIAINTYPDAKHDMLMNVLNACFKAGITHINVINAEK